jgi:hypothetical protein
MAAEDEMKVTVHQAEWGDTRGEAPPPSGPTVPGDADAADAVFHPKGFTYGEGLRYSRRSRYGQVFRYDPHTEMNRTWNNITDSQYRMNRRYKGAGQKMRNGYKPNIQYAPGIQRRSGFRYGFSR